MTDEKHSSAPTGPLSAVRGFGFSEDKNERYRRTMEDAHVFFDGFAGNPTQMFCGVYDGHGGREAVEHAAARLHVIFQELLQQHSNAKPIDLFDDVFARTDQEMAEQNIDFNGTTAVVGFLRREPRGRVLYTANCGDARAVLVRRNEDGSVVGYRVSFDHKPNLPEEVERIRQASGFVCANRVNGILSVSRALGDHAMKQFVISKPFVLETVLRDSDTHLVVCCDGVWDVLSDQDVATEVSRHPDCASAATALKDLALAKGSMDNISAMVIRL